MLTWFKKNHNPDEPQTLGQIGEALARLEYERRGYEVVAANFFNRKGKQLGEVDFIAAGRGAVMFVEVKTRARERGLHGTPAEAVNYFKQVKLLKAVKVFLAKQPKYRSLRPQIDVVTVILPEQSGLMLAQTNPDKFEVAGELDKLSRNVTILPNAVEDRFS